MIQELGIDQIAQHVTVFIVALAAAFVVLRRVFGVFETRPTTAGSGAMAQATPGCSHCAAGSAAAKKLAHR